MTGLQEAQKSITLALDIVDVDRNEMNIDGLVSGAKMRESMTVTLESLSDKSTDNHDSALSDQGCKHQPLTKPKRAQKKTILDRRSALATDVAISVVEENRVKCKGCSKWIKLSDRTAYEIKNWEVHKNSCPQITGVQTQRVRSAVLKKVIPKTGASSITSYFSSNNRKSDTSSPVASPIPNTKQLNNGAYILRTVKATRSITQFLSQTAETFHPQPQPIVPIVPCQGLVGKHLEEYITRSQTRKFGGISPALRARVAHQLFPYKPFSPLKTQELARGSYKCDLDIEHEIPDCGNREVEGLCWTSEEKLKFDATLSAWARWELDPVLKTVRSTRCHGTTNQRNAVCSACTSVNDDSSFKKAIKRANEQSKLSLVEQREVLARRVKYAPHTAQTLEAHTLLKKLQDPVLFDLHRLLNRGQDVDCFFQLYLHAQEGNLKNMDVFHDICEVLVDKLNRELSDNPNAKYGIRYPQNFLNFMTLVRSHGSNSAQQYSLLAPQLGGPSARHLR
ncbi:hypothetical protein C0992_008380, partial [Termitomyces sp. T32_za158]